MTRHAMIAGSTGARGGRLHVMLRRIVHDDNGIALIVVRPVHHGTEHHNAQREQQGPRGNAQHPSRQPQHMVHSRSVQGGGG